MEQQILSELQELKKLTLLSAKNVLTLNDVCILTNLSKSHIYKLTHKKQIPYWKSEGGKYLFFDKKEIENWLLHTRIKTNAELETEAANYCLTQSMKGGKK